MKKHRKLKNIKLNEDEDEIDDFDIILGYMAKQRAKNSKPEDFIPAEKVMKKLGINLN